MPGPLVTVAIAGVGRLGGLSGLVASAGHGIPEALLVVALALGFGGVLRIPLVTGLIAVIGGVVLAWMAIGMFRSAATVEIATAAEAEGPAEGGGHDAIGGSATAGRHAASNACVVADTRIPQGIIRAMKIPRPRAAFPTMAAGAAASVSNPYWILWWTTIGATYVSQALGSGWAGVGFFFGGHILSDILWLTFVSSAIAVGSSFLTRNFYTRLIQVLASLLFLMAIYFLFTGVKTLF